MILKAATTLMDFLFVGLVLHVKQMCCQQCQQQHLDLPSDLPSKYYPALMLLNVSVRMGVGVSNMGWSADMVKNVYHSIAITALSDHSVSRVWFSRQEFKLMKAGNLSRSRISFH